jgi:phosphate-selective porin OprO/OprP
MLVLARYKVYKLGRVTILLTGVLSPLRAVAQEPAVPPPPAAVEATPPAPAAPGDLSPEVARRLDDLDQRTRIVDRKLELAEEAAAANRKETPVLTAEDKGFALASPDRAYEFRLRGLVQFDARRHFDTSDPALADKDTFLLRRIRPIFDGTILGLVDFRISPDFGNNQVAVLDAYLDAHPRPWLRLRAGKFKPPVGLERLQADNNVALMERALDSNLTAQRDVGLELWGDIANGAVRYELAIFNGVPDGALNDIDSNHDKTYAGRLFLRPFQLGDLGGLGDLGVGIAASTGLEKGSSALTNNVAASTWLPSFKSAAQDTIFTYVSSTMDPTQTVFALGRHTRINPQLYYYKGPVGLLAEWVREYQEVGKGAAGGAVNNQAGHVTASVVVGGDNTYDGVKPRKVADWATREVGAIELAARFNWLDVDDVGFPGAVFADPAKSVTKAQGFGVGLNWWLNRSLKVSVNWERTTFGGGAAKGADRPTEQVGMGRFQVAF